MNKEDALIEAKSLFFGFKVNAKQIQRKKRWLLGITSTKYDRKRFKKLKFLQDKFTPESLLRDDDIFYESTRTYVEGLFRVCHIEGEFDVTLDNELSVAAKKILGSLKTFSHQTLDAMYRKLKGVKATMPQLRTGRKKWGQQNDLIKKVRKIGFQMLREQVHELPDPLAKAMAVAHLSLKLANHKVTFLKKFDQLTLKVKPLQDDIMKAIWRVEKEVKIEELRRLVPTLLEQDAKISNRLLRKAFVELLTEFLFECNDMEKIPEFFLDILNIINGSSGYRPLQSPQQEKIEEEVDGILNLSAQTKQLVTDLLLDYGFDEDFDDAYIEQSLRSDVDDYDDCQIEKTAFITGGNSIGCELGETLAGMNPTSMLTNSLCEIVEPELSKNMTSYKYHAIQDASDKTSILTHKLIGRVLWEFAKLDGLDLNESQSLYLTGDNKIKDVKVKARQSSSKKDPRNSAVVRAVEKLVPSFPDSGSMERLKKLIG